MARDQIQLVEFLVQAKYRKVTYPAGAEVDVLQGDVDSLIADGVIDKNAKLVKVKPAKDAIKNSGGVANGGAAGGDQ